MARQLTFELPARAALGRDDFFVSPANAAAVNAVENSADWPGGKLLLCGPQSAGKTHLCHVWAALAQARIVAATDLATGSVAALLSASPHIAVEDIDRIAGLADGERALLHLHNLALAEGGQLLMTCTTPPTARAFTLPDLQSRMRGTLLSYLSPPDDALLCAVLVKLFADRQLTVPASVISYMSHRMERSFDAATRLVAATDALSLAERRPITRTLAARVLDKLSQAGA
jgi:chromosomal replication initiation ATPase DnaA